MYEQPRSKLTTCVWCCWLASLARSSLRTLLSPGSLASLAHLEIQKLGFVNVVGNPLDGETETVPAWNARHVSHRADELVVRDGVDDAGVTSVPPVSPGDRSFCLIWDAKVILLVEAEVHSVLDIGLQEAVHIFVGKESGAGNCDLSATRNTAYTGTDVENVKMHLHAEAAVAPPFPIRFHPDGVDSTRWLPEDGAVDEGVICKINPARLVADVRLDQVALVEPAPTVLVEVVVGAFYNRGEPPPVNVEELPGHAFQLVRVASGHPRVHGCVVGKSEVDRRCVVKVPGELKGVNNCTERSEVSF